MWLQIIFGISSGLTLSINLKMLMMWISIISKKTHDFDEFEVGLTYLVLLPFSFSYIWTMIFEYFQISGFLRKYCSWLTCINFYKSNHFIDWFIFLTLGIFIVMNFISYFIFINNIKGVILCSIIISILVASRDDILGVLRIYIADNHIKNTGFFNIGYKIGMIIAGSLSIHLAFILGWSLVYLIVNLLVVIWALLLVCALHHRIDNNNIELNKIQIIKTNDIISSWRILIGKFNGITGTCLLLTGLFLYRLPDNLIMSMQYLILLETGYGQMIAYGNFIGIIGVFIGNIIATQIMHSKTVTIMIYSGILHLMTHCLWIGMLSAPVSKEYYSILCICESITGGLCMSAYIGWIANLSTGSFCTTKYALLTSVMGISKSICPIMAGWILKTFGYYILIYSAMVINVIGILYLYLAQKYKYKGFYDY